MLATLKTVVKLPLTSRDLDFIQHLLKKEKKEKEKSVNLPS